LPGQASGRPFTIGSFVAAAISLLAPFAVIIGGLTAIVLGFLAWRKGDALARVALVVAVVALIIGLITGGLPAILEEI